MGKYEFIVSTDHGGIMIFADSFNFDESGLEFYERNLEEMLTVAIFKKRDHFKNVGLSTKEIKY